MSQQIPSSDMNFEDEPGSHGEYDVLNDAQEVENLLLQQNRELDAQVKDALAARIDESRAETLPHPDSYFLAKAKQSISNLLSNNGLDASKAAIAPTDKKNTRAQNSDLALNVAGMAKEAGKSPVDIAQGIGEQIATNDSILEAKAVGPFINIELDYRKGAPQILGQVAELGEKYGHFREGDPKLVIVDFSSPNVAKNMTVAHLRSTIIGQSLVKIQAAAGNTVFGINHIGDWGTQFGNIIYEYRRELAEKGDAFTEELNNDPTATLLRIYRQFNERKDQDLAAVEEAQAIFLQLEQGDPELVTLWDQFRKWSLRDFGPSYDRLRVKFDAIQGESFYEDRMEEAVSDALDNGVLVENESGAVVFPSQTLTDPTTGKVNAKIMLDKDKQPRDEIIVKPTGGTVYLTRDLAAIRYRATELNADKILYVIGKEQQAHCIELFAMSSQLGLIPHGDARHISFGHLNVDGRKMKSREGKVALLNDIVDESIDAAGVLIQVRKEERGDYSPLSESEQEVAQKIGVGAIIFNDLKQNREKDIEFDPNTARILEAGSSAYIQYTNTRLNSIVEKVGEPPELTDIPPLNLSERVVLTQIALFPEIIKEAAERNAPHRIANYLTELCQSVNSFYQHSPVANAETQSEKTFRLHLVKASQQVIKNASYLLHIELPERM